MTDPTELDELESLLTSGAWQRVVQHYEQEWGPGGQTYQDAVKRAISGPSGSEAEAVHRLKNVTYAQTAIANFINWPRERVAVVKRLKGGAALVGGPSRRGPGL